MRSRKKKIAVTLALLVSTAIAALELEPEMFVRTAHAVIGRPLTPLSYAGVARRTTRRTIMYTNMYSNTYASPGVW